MARVVSVARMRDKLEGQVNVAGKEGVKVKLARDDRQFFDPKTKWLISGKEVKALPPQPSQKILAWLAEGGLVFVDEQVAQIVQAPAEPDNLSKASVESVEPEVEEKPKKKTPAKKKKTPAKKKTAPKKKTTASKGKKGASKKKE